MSSVAEEKKMESTGQLWIDGDLERASLNESEQNVEKAVFVVRDSENICKVVVCDLLQLAQLFDLSSAKSSFEYFD